MRHLKFNFVFFIALVMLSSCEKDTSLDAVSSQNDVVETRTTSLTYKVEFFDNAGYSVKLLNGNNTFTVDIQNPVPGQQYIRSVAALNTTNNNKITSYRVTDLNVGSRGMLNVVLYDGTNFTGFAADHACAAQGCGGGITNPNLANSTWYYMNNKASSIRVYATYRN